MHYREEKYLSAALKLLEKWIPSPPAVMMEKWKGQSEDEADWNVEEAAGGLVFCIFGWPETDSERCVLLVYDEQMRVIADASAVHCSVSALLGSSKLYDELSEESDWMYLEHYTLCGYMFPQYEYPFCLQGKAVKEKGEALLFSSLYVTGSYRRRGIFTVMIQMMRDFALRRSSGNTELYSVISLDPDIAVYGPDAKDEPYYYSFEKDEPVRQLNAMILEKAGFDVLRLEETEEDPEADGTKLWFAVKKENDLIVDVQEKDYANLVGAKQWLQAISWCRFKKTRMTNKLFWGDFEQSSLFHTMLSEANTARKSQEVRNLGSFDRRWLLQ